MKSWGEIAVEDGTEAPVKIGPLDLRLHRTGSLWRIAQRVMATEDAQGTPDESEDWPENGDWTSWSTVATDTSLKLEPCAPDRPLVIRPQEGFRLLPGVELEFYVPIPLWVRLLASGKKWAKLCEIPTHPLSNTWFGEPHDGEFCYSLKTNPVLDWASLEIGDHEALLQVTLRNASKEELTLARLFIRAAHLGVFQGRKNLWYSAVRAVYEGGTNVGSVDYRKTPPSIDEAERQLGEPREPYSRSMPRAGAGLLKSLQGYASY